ncbi:MAG: Rrf2 family transcriptional regulator [Bryobacterales bacterium]|nr:Rrf2 family transcriptional regulator [Bryobacterales bacterium]
MLRLSKKADYGLIALMHLAAGVSGRGASAKEIAEAYQLPLPLLAKVLQRLAQSGFLKAAYGTKGGYRLARHASRISALQVIRAIDGPVFLTACSTRAGGCTQTAKCTARRPLQKIREDILSLLDGISIEEMSAGRKPEPPLVGLSSARTL